MEKPFNVIFGHAFIPKAEVPDNDTPPKPIVLESWDDEFTKAILAVCLLMSKRKREIAENKNGYTTNPLYVVYQSAESLSSSDDFQVGTSKFSEYQNDHYRRYTESGESFISDTDPEWPADADHYEPVTVDDVEYKDVVRCGIHDEFVTACFTRAAAEEFIERERHNLRDPRIWVDSIPHRSTDMLELLSALDVITNKVESAAHVTVVSNG